MSRRLTSWVFAVAVCGSTVQAFPGTPSSPGAWVDAYDRPSLFCGSFSSFRVMPSNVGTVFAIQFSSFSLLVSSPILHLSERAFHQTSLRRCFWQTDVLSQGLQFHIHAHRGISKCCIQGSGLTHNDPSGSRGRVRFLNLHIPSMQRHRAQRNMAANLLQHQSEFLGRMSCWLNVFFPCREQNQSPQEKKTLLTVIQKEWKTLLLAMFLFLLGGFLLGDSQAKKRNLQLHPSQKLEEARLDILALRREAVASLLILIVAGSLMLRVFISVLP